MLQAIPRGIPLCSGGGQAAAVSGHRGRVSREPQKDAAVRRPEERPQRRRGTCSMFDSVPKLLTIIGRIIKLVRRFINVFNQEQ